MRTRSHGSKFSRAVTSASEFGEIDCLRELCWVKIVHLSARVRLAPNDTGTVAVQKTVVGSAIDPSCGFEEVNTACSCKFTAAHVDEPSSDGKSDLVQVCKFCRMGMMDLQFKPVGCVRFAFVHVQVVPESSEVRAACVRHSIVSSGFVHDRNIFRVKCEMFTNGIVGNHHSVFTHSFVGDRDNLDGESGCGTVWKWSGRYWIEMVRCSMVRAPSPSATARSARVTSEKGRRVVSEHFILFYTQQQKKR